MVNKNKYIRNLERELRKAFRRNVDWIEKALDLKETIENQKYEIEVQFYYCWWAYWLVLLCGILAMFDYLVLRRLL